MHKERDVQLEMFVSDKKYSVALDFDGVIHRYIRPWCGAATAPDDPTPGALQAIRNYQKRYNVIIYSARANTPDGIDCIIRYLKDMGLSDDEVGAIKIYAKPHAILYIDDRAFQFTGQFPTVEDVESFSPWNAVLRRVKDILRHNARQPATAMGKAANYVAKAMNIPIREAENFIERWEDA